MPWWGWVILALVGLVALLVSAARAFRRKARRDFIAHMREGDPGLELLEQRDAWLRVRSPKLGEGQIFLSRLYAAASS